MSASSSDHFGHDFTALDPKNHENKNVLFQLVLMHPVEKLLQYYCCAKRSFPSVVPENLLSVRSSVKKIIDFCEGDLEGASLLLSTGSLNF